MKPLLLITCGQDQDGRSRQHVYTEYIRGVELAGGLPLLLPNLKATADIDDILGRVHGLLLPGGIDIDPIYQDEEPLPGLGEVDPENDAVQLYAARAALARKLPILGICRGIQVLNVAAGGDIYQDIETQVPHRVQHMQRSPSWHGSHHVDVRAGSTMEEVLGGVRARVNSFHHQSVRRVAPGFDATARSDDGLVEAVEAKGHRFEVGVQWHPECMLDTDRAAVDLFRVFVDAAKAFE